MKRIPQTAMNKYRSFNNIDEFCKYFRYSEMDNKSKGVKNE